MAKSLGPKPANQGSAGKPYVQPVRTSGTPSAAKPGKSEIKFGVQPGGTRGSK
jgi:hypothetical protein